MFARLPRHRCGAAGLARWLAPESGIGRAHAVSPSGLPRCRSPERRSRRRSRSAGTSISSRSSTRRSDRDLAVALGWCTPICGWRRWSCCGASRRAVSPRRSGIAALPLDRAVHAIDIARAVPAIVERLPDDTRDWLARVCRRDQSPHRRPSPPPLELRLLGIAADRWRIADVVAIARLAAVDAMWMLWPALLPLRNRPDWPGDLGAFAGRGHDRDGRHRRGAREYGDARQQCAGDRRLAQRHRIDVACRRCASPAHPAERLARGRVSLAVLQSRRADVPGIAGHVYRPQPASRLGRHQSAGGQQRVVRCLRIAAPGDPRAPGADRRALVASARDCAARHGLRPDRLRPAAFPAKPGEMLALRWVGHLPSDEITALLAINRAQDAASFREAAEGNRGSRSEPALRHRFGADRARFRCLAAAPRA